MCLVSIFCIYVCKKSGGFIKLYVICFFFILRFFCTRMNENGEGEMKELFGLIEFGEKSV